MAATKSNNNTAEVVSRILTEDVISIKQAQAELSKLLGERPDKSTMIRWVQKGVGGVKLEAIKLGGRNIFTSTEALNRFIVARTAQLTR